MADKPIIPTTEEILSTMEAELYKARCIVLTEVGGSPSLRPCIFRVDAIVSWRPLVFRDTYDGGLGRTKIVRVDGGGIDVAESVAEVLTRIARVEKDR